MVEDKVIVETLSQALAELRGRESQMQTELADLRRAIEAVGTTLSLYQQKVDIPISERMQTMETIVDELRGMTHLDALKLIAVRGGGRFRLTYARDLMDKAGLLKNPKNALGSMSTTMDRSGLFKRVSRGEYELLSESDQTGTENA